MHFSQPSSKNISANKVAQEDTYRIWQIVMQVIRKKNKDVCRKQGEGDSCSVWDFKCERNYSFPYSFTDRSVISSTKRWHHFGVGNTPSACHLTPHSPSIELNAWNPQKQNVWNQVFAFILSAIPFVDNIIQASKYFSFCFLTLGQVFLRIYSAEDRAVAKRYL